jgi:hypothetical protein
MEMAMKTMKRAARGAGRRRRGELLPCRRLHGGEPPLSPLPSWLLGSPPHGDGVHGGGKKCGFGRLQFVGGGVPHEFGFLPLHSFSDFHHPI